METKEMIETLRYKAENIKAHIEPEFFNEVADRLEELEKKQIGIKVRIKVYDDGYPDYYCPICSKQQKATRKNKAKGCFCERCGQKLKWSEDDE